MKVTSQSKRYAPEAVRARYVRFDRTGGMFHFCEVGEDRRFDLRQGIVDESELPRAVASAARARVGFTPGYVDWPLP